MRLPNFLTSWLCKWAMRRSVRVYGGSSYGHIYRNDGKSYMGRYPVFGPATADEPRNERFPLAARVNIVESSDYPIFHDHPVSFIAILLAGDGYYESVPEFNDDGSVRCTITTYHPRGSVLFRRADQLHYLTLPMNTDGETEPSVSLFISWRKVREWGFLRTLSDGTHPEWIHHSEYKGPQ